MGFWPREHQAPGTSTHWLVSLRRNTELLVDDSDCRKEYLENARNQVFRMNTYLIPDMKLATRLWRWERGTPPSRAIDLEITVLRAPWTDEKILKICQRKKIEVSASIFLRVFCSATEAATGTRVERTSPKSPCVGYWPVGSLYRWNMNYRLFPGWK